LLKDGFKGIKPKTFHSTDCKRCTNTMHSSVYKFNFRVLIILSTAQS
jgi:hypothetical protein